MDGHSEMNVVGHSGGIAHFVRGLFMEHEGPRRKYLPVVYIAGPLLAACVTAAIAWESGAGELESALIAFSAALGLAVTARVGAYALPLIFSDEARWDGLPLEQSLPLKGRWLRLLALGPPTLLGLGVFWLAATAAIGIALVLLAVLVGTLLTIRLG